MPYTHTVTFIDGPRSGFDVEAEIEYAVQPASGDGWNEPREPATAEIVAVTLYKVTRTNAANRPTREPLPGETPAWVVDMLEAQEWWQDVELEECA